MMMHWLWHSVVGTSLSITDSLCFIHLSDEAVPFCLVMCHDLGGGGGEGGGGGGVC